MHLNAMAAALLLALAPGASAEPPGASARPSPPASRVMDALGDVGKVDWDNMARVTELLYRASESLHARWEPALVREAARVVGLSMDHFDKTHESIVSPFHLQLLGPRRKEFLDLVLPVLGGTRREAFLGFVRALESAVERGNG